MCDGAFMQLMLEIKYANLGNAGVMSGCRSYSSTYAAAVSESGVNRIVLTASQANYFIVGSRVSLGTGTDRAKATCYDVHDIATVASIEDIDDLKDQHAKDIAEVKAMHHKDTEGIQEEQTVVVYGLLACLKGLAAQGCNGPVSEAIDRIEKHINKKAHGQD